MEAADRLVVAGQRTLALADVDLHRRLVVGRRREDLALTGRDRRIGLDQLGHHTAQGFDTQRQRSDIQQQHVLHLTGQDTALDRSADGNDFVGVHSLAGHLTEEILDDLLDRGNTGRTAHEDHLVDLLGIEPGITQSYLARLDGLVDQVIAQLLEFGTRKRHNQVLRNTVDRHDVRKVDLRSSRGRQFDLRLLGSFLQTLHGHRVLAQIHVVLGFECLGHIIDQHMVEIIAAQVRIAVGRFHFEHAVAQLQDRNIERTAAQVEDSDFHVIAFFIQTVSQCSGRRLVDDTTHFQSRNLTGLLRGLTLRVGEIGRNGNHRFRNLLPQVILGRLFHLLKNDRRNLLRRVLPSVDIHTRRIVVAAYYLIRSTLDLRLYLIVGLAHETFDRENRTFRISNCLTFSRISHFTFSIVGECDDRRSRTMPFGIRNYDGFVTFHHCDTRVRRAQVNTNNLCHNIVDL